MEIHEEIAVVGRKLLQIQNAVEVDIRVKLGNGTKMLENSRNFQHHENS